MSISRFQEKFLAKGCGTMILIGCAGVFGALAFSYFGKGASYGSQDPESRPAKIVVTVAGVQIPSTRVDALIQQRLQQQPGMDPNAQPPAAQASAYGDVLGALLDQAAMVAIAKTQGMSATDDQLREAFRGEIAQQIERIKLNLMISGKIKPNATDAEVDAAVKAQSGKSLTEMQQSYSADFETVLKDPAKRPEIVDSYTGPLLQGMMAARFKPTDTEVKASYDLDTFKKILLKDKPAPSPTLDSRVASVEKDLKSGTSFEQAMDRYSDDAPLPKHRISDKPDVISMAQLNSDKSLKPLKSLKVGEVSEPLKTRDGTAIYKLIAVKNQAPADFDKNIAKYRKQYQEATAKETLEAQVEELVKSKIEWGSKGYQAVYDATRPDVDASKGQALLDEARAAISKTDGYDLRPAQLAEYAAFDLIWNAPGADKVKLRTDRIRVLNDYLQNAENFSVRMELVGLYQDEKNGSAAADCLVAAARSNNSYDDIGQAHFGDVAARLLTLKNSGLAKPDQIQAVEAAQAQWKKDQSEYQTAIAQRKLQDAEDARKAKEEEAKDRAAAEKARADAAKTPKTGMGAGSSPSFSSEPIAPPGPGTVSGSATSPFAPSASSPASGAPKH